MAKIRNLDPNTGVIRMRGSLSVRANKRTGWVAQSWPKRTSNMNAPGRVQSRNNFAAAVQLIKYCTGEELQAAIELTKGKGWIPRDALMSAAFGNLIVAYAKDGTIWSGRANFMSDIQTMLDSISNVEGDMLWRSSVGWAPLSGRSPGFVLTGLPGAGYPAWRPLPPLDLTALTHTQVIGRAHRNGVNLGPIAVGAPRLVPLTTLSFQTSPMFDSINGWWVIQTQGYYRIHASVSVTAPPAASLSGYASIQVNGLEQTRGSSGQFGNNFSAFTSNLSDIVGPLVTNDLVKLFFTPFAANTVVQGLAVSTHCTIERIAPYTVEQQT